MAFESIIIRRAKNRDIEGIWDLLHADCKGWSEEQICSNLSYLLVLTKHDKLLGVLFGELTSGKKEVFWIVIHPLYPEELLKKMLFQGLKGGSFPIFEEERIINVGRALTCPR
jgi:hypothetical protein